MPSALLLFLILAISFVLTMVGLGGGLVFAPLFVLLDFPLQTAVCTSLFLNGTAATAAAITYARRRMVDFQAGLPLLLASTAAAPLGALLTARLPVRLFTLILAAVISVAALRMLFSGQPARATEPIGAARRTVGGAAVGGLIGLAGGLLGIGGGVFIVPLLIYVLRLPPKTAAATSIFVVVFSSFSGFLAHFSLAAIQWRFILLAGVFSFAGGQLGSRIMAERLKGRTVRRLFGGVLVLFVFKLLARSF